jgi:sirohydrochlorin ferrochelatase
VLAGRHEPAWVLVHSPLVGPTSWSQAADELRRRGRAAVVPSLLGVAAWNRRACADLLLTAEPYGQSADEARSLGWPVLEIQDVRHLAIATDAIPVTDALLDLERELESSAPSDRHG